jgi:hypothetical protein
MRLVFLFASLLRPTASRAETVPVRYPEGVSHGYLVLRTLEGKPIADGDSTQVAGSDRVTSRMRFRFKDGSIYEETTVFSQHGIHLEIAPQGQEPFSNGIYKHRAVHYLVKVKIGGVAGVVAPLVGKQPPDTHAWILGDDAPAFVKSEGPLYGDGPVWQMELAVPTIWPQNNAPVRSQK